MSDHTPGPWHCTPEEELHKIGVYVGQFDDVVICDVTDEDLEGDKETVAKTCEANARLIAAAPELLSIVEQILNDIESTDYGCSISQATDDLARSIVAKAKGRA